MTLKQQSITYTNGNNTHLLLARMNSGIEAFTKESGSYKVSILRILSNSDDHKENECTSFSLAL